MIFSTCFQYVWCWFFCTWPSSACNWRYPWHGRSLCLLKSLFLFRFSTLTCLSIQGLWTLVPRSSFWGIYFSISLCILHLNLVTSYQCPRKWLYPGTWNSVAYSQSSFFESFIVGSPVLINCPQCCLGFDGSKTRF